MFQPNSAITVKQNNSTDDNLEHSKMKGDKHKMMLGQQHTWLQWREKDFSDCSPILLSSLLCSLEAEHSLRLRRDEIPAAPSSLPGRELRLGLGLKPLGGAHVPPLPGRAAVAAAGHSAPGPALQGRSREGKATLLFFHSSG